jgi:uncharacterized membrane protein (DUF106 family)
MRAIVELPSQAPKSASPDSEMDSMSVPKSDIRRLMISAAIPFLVTFVYLYRFLHKINYLVPEVHSIY